MQSGDPALQPVLTRVCLVLRSSATDLEQSAVQMSIFMPFGLLLVTQRNNSFAVVVLLSKPAVRKDISRQRKQFSCDQGHI